MTATAEHDAVAAQTVHLIDTARDPRSQGVMLHVLVTCAWLADQGAHEHVARVLSAWTAATEQDAS